MINKCFHRLVILYKMGLIRIHLIRSKFPFALESKSLRVSSAIYNELGKLLQSTMWVSWTNFASGYRKLYPTQISQLRANM